MTTDAAPSFLFVDEDPLQLSALRRLLRDVPGIKRAATSAEEALRMAEEEPPSVVIAAYILPGMDGLSLIAALRARHPATLCGLHTTQLPGRDIIPPGITILLKPCPPERLRAFLLSGTNAAPK
ncbi:response regulator transcription factor [Melittangium boletus]|uniref:Transcriptional regulator n=1 Tax=Melittangium boletus DSM 14713 TaxID=1294270 RepID=A0A250I9K6_9BACT|nr:response regulator [Melittangium boletus]ATB28425.1 transcriptional regulator [Melittangium boletus DSM 14713]